MPGLFRRLNSLASVRATFPEEATYQLRALIETYDRIVADRPAGQALPGSDREIELLRQKLQNAPDELWWTDVSQAEVILIDLLPPEAVQARLRSWRRRFREVVGETRYALYQATAPDINSPNPNPETLRADLSECVRAVYYFYSVYGLAARSRSSVTKTMFIVAVAILVFESLLAIVLTSPTPSGWLKLSPGFLDYLLLTSAAAVLGSLVSIQRRLQDPTVDVDPIFRYIQLKADRFSVAFVSPLFGAIFGIVTYGLLVSGLVTGGPIFPKFTETALPAGAPSIALLLLYGFLSGFSEQFVPDALNRVAARALPFVGANAPAPAAPSPPFKADDGAH